MNTGTLPFTIPLEGRASSVYLVQIRDEGNEDIGKVSKVGRKWLAWDTAGNMIGDAATRTDAGWALYKLWQDAQ